MLLYSEKRETNLSEDYIPKITASSVVDNIMTATMEDRNDVAFEDRDDNIMDHYCKPYRTLRYSFLESLSDFSERLLGPVDMFCHPKIKAEIKCAIEKPRLMEPVPPARVQKEPVKRETPIMITTSERELAEILGKVVDVVIAATQRGSDSYDYSALNTLFVQNNGRQHCENEEITITYQELQKVIMKIAVSSRESVKESIGIPGGIVISNFGPTKSTVELNWAC